MGISWPLAGFIMIAADNNIIMARQVIISLWHSPDDHMLTLSDNAWVDTLNLFSESRLGVTFSF